MLSTKLYVFDNNLSARPQLHTPLSTLNTQIILLDILNLLADFFDLALDIDYLVSENGVLNL